MGQESEGDLGYELSPSRNHGVHRHEAKTYAACPEVPVTGSIALVVLCFKIWSALAVIS